MFISDPEKSTGISISTIMSYYKAIKHCAKYCEKNNLSIKKILQNHELMTKYISTISTRNILTGLSSVLTHLIKIPSDITGYKVLSTIKFNTIKRKLNTLDEDKQHPVIPSRILAELINQLSKFISNFFKIKDRFFYFIKATLECDRYARSESLQVKIGYKARDFKPFFKEAAQEHGLWNFFHENNIINMPSLSTFIVRLQHATRIMIHIFTGMRSSESLSITINSLQSYGNIYKIKGYTSKLVGQKKMTSWITSKDIVEAYEIAELLAKLVYMKIEVINDLKPLFVSTSYLSLSNSVSYDGINLKVATASIKANEIYNILDQTKFKVTNQDINELEKINPFRAWESEKAFSIGTTWRFTIHQFRRSLAFYVAQSALVSLPSLKRQLKHISRDMTIYYCQANELSNEFISDSHFSTLIRHEKPEADACAYINDILMSSDPLYGAHGTFIKKHGSHQKENLILKEDRDKLIENFKKGEIAYTETPLGACTTITPCDEKLLRSITACLTCARSVIKMHKLDRVIGRQQRLVDELSASSPNSIELRTEKEDLSLLIEYKHKITTNER